MNKSTALIVSILVLLIGYFTVDAAISLTPEITEEDEFVALNDFIGVEEISDEDIQKTLKIEVSKYKVGAGKVLTAPLVGKRSLRRLPGGMEPSPPLRVAMPVTSARSKRVHPTNNTSNSHTGTDIGVPSGTPIYSIAPGTVVLAERNGGYGNCVIVDHGQGLSSLYAHMSSIDVQKGQAVTPDNILGKVGNTGVSSGAHLHIEVRFNYKNEMYFLNSQDFILYDYYIGMQDWELKCAKNMRVEVTINGNQELGGQEKWLKRSERNSSGYAPSNPARFEYPKEWIDENIIYPIQVPGVSEDRIYDIDFVKQQMGDR